MLRSSKFLFAAPLALAASLRQHRRTAETAVMQFSSSLPRLPSPCWRRPVQCRLPSSLLWSGAVRGVSSAALRTVKRRSKGKKSLWKPLSKKKKMKMKRKPNARHAKRRRSRSKKGTAKKRQRTAKNVRPGSVKLRRAVEKNKGKKVKSSGSARRGHRRLKKKLRGHQLAKMRYNKRVAAIAKLWKAQQEAVQRPLVTK